MSGSDNQFFKDGSIQVKKLSEWLDWAGGTNQEVFVALPMIQRGSVWKPNQIIDLWDTLLRGMPVGSLMAQSINKDAKVRQVGGSELEKIPENGGLSLLDGQQRTLSMLIPWQKEVMDKKIWVDFGDMPQDEHLFRLRVTTENHPFGFQKASPSARLSLGDRNKARLAHDAEHPDDKQSESANFFNYSKPWGSVLPMDLAKLIVLWKTHNKEACIAAIIENLKIIKHFQFDRFEENEGAKQPIFNEIITWNGLTEDKKLEAKERVSDFYEALRRFFSLQIPIIEVSSEMLDAGKAGQNETKDDIAPPLAVLFKRIGTGGTSLTDADYIYSLIKHRIPDAYTLVEDLHKNPNVASLLTATDLVMSAVRLAAAEFNDNLTDEKLRIYDWESPNKQQFHSLLKKESLLNKGPEDNQNKVLSPLLGDGTLKKSFIVLSKLLEYRGEGDVGLPEYAFPLLRRPLIQVLLRWVRLVQLHHSNEAESIFDENRKNILRFVLYWRVFVLDAKVSSTLAFKLLDDNVKNKNTHNTFPDKAIYKELISKKLAIAIVAPDDERIKNIAFSKDGDWLRGWRRFHITKEAATDEEFVGNVKLYQRWWGGENGHVHPILLWLQRDFVSNFRGNPMAGRDEETPYDYDHICPSSHWYNNSKSDSSNSRIIDFFNKIKKDDVLEKDSEGHWRVGNSIGNLRVCGSSENRSDGDDTPSKKLKLNDKNDECKELLQQSAIAIDHIEFWQSCSGIEGKGKLWSKERTQAFQRAVEQRAFALYTSYFDDLNFKEWLSIDGKS